MELSSSRSVTPGLFFLPSSCCHGVWVFAFSKTGEGQLWQPSLAADGSGVPSSRERGPAREMLLHHSNFS